MSCNFSLTYPCLRALPEFQMLNDLQLGVVAEASRFEECHAGDVLFRQEDTSLDLYLVLSGRLTVRQADGNDRALEYRHIEANEWTGELSILGGEPRLATVVCETPCRLLRVNIPELQGLKHGAEVLSCLKGELAKLAVRRIRTMSRNVIAAMKAEAAQQSLQTHFGYFLIYTMTLLLTTTAFLYLVKEHFVIDATSTLFSWQVLITFLLPSTILVRKLGIPLRDMGIKREGLWSSVRETLLIGSVLLPVCALGLGTYKSIYHPHWDGEQSSISYLMLYFVHCSVQELGARGLVQGLFKRFLSDESGHRSIFLTSAIFSSVHVILSADVVFVSFFVSLFLGYLYNRQGNLAGVALMHFGFGYIAVSFGII